MHRANSRSIIRRFAALVLAALTALQVSVSLAKPGGSCPMGDCDVAMECVVASCTACVVLPVVSAEIMMSPIYLSEIQPAQWLGQVPEGASSDIWRPPRTGS